MPKSFVFYAGKRVAEMPGGVGSDRVGSIPLVEHTLNHSLTRSASHELQIFPVLVLVDRTLGGGGWLLWYLVRDMLA